jgi:hypothetical protein
MFIDVIIMRHNMGESDLIGVDGIDNGEYVVPIDD